MLRYWLSLTLGLACAPLAAAHDDPQDLARQARGVLKRHCQRCHNGPGSDSGRDFDVLRVPTLLTRSKEGVLLVPREPKQSLLYTHMLPREGRSARMPPRSVKERPNPADLAIVEKWIEAGAPELKVEQRAFIGTDALLTKMSAYLKSAAQKDPSVPRHIRFFTLTVQHNNPRLLDTELAQYRLALAKALNSLTWQRNIVVPEAVDKAGTVYAIDLRDLKWTDQTWQTLLSHNPYGLIYCNHPDAKLRQLDQEVSQLSGCDQAYVRADWFLAAATRPPLYHLILDLPASDWQLENRLGVDARRNFEVGKVARAGFSRSGVSRQNRLVERHESLYGACWKSYDFREKGARNDLKQFPLGPVNLYPERQHPHADQAFVHDGGEMIFNLPNHMQAYFLVNGNGERIDEGPTDVVEDLAKTSGTHSIANGLSCMSCHSQGMIRFKDDLREGAAVFGPAKLKLKQLHPEPKVMEKWLDQDEQRFLQAMQKTWSPFVPGLKTTADMKEYLKQIEEPIGAAARAYRLQPLDLEAVARELGMNKAASLPGKIGENRFRELGLAILLRQDGVINRAEWERGSARSMMQRLAVELDATPLAKSSNP